MRLPLAVRLLSLATVVSSSPAMFARDDTCAAGGLQSCSAQGLSSSFCCETGRICMTLAGHSTVMCCPNGSSCDVIRPITCDIETQNPNTNVRAPIKTLALKSKLPKCATNDSCCPFGFTCAADGKLCFKNEDQSLAPEGYTPTTSSVSTAATVPASTSTKSSPATTAGATATATASAEPSQAPGHDGVGLGPGKTSIIGGAVGGALALIFLIVIIFLCVRSRKGDASSMRSFPYSQSSGVGPHGHKISAPIPNPETSYRTDFIRKTPSMRSSESSPPSRFSQTPQLGHPPPVNPRLSIPNPFDSPTSSCHSAADSRCSAASDEYDRVYTGQVGARLRPIRALTPSAVRESRRISRGDFQDVMSSESGSMFADASPPSGNKSGQNQYRQTSFSDMMEAASMKDVHKGQPYVPGGTKRHVPGTTPRI
ncbi:hypothetical protein E4U43_007612 [Claviceps pusilla]|uniref:Mid2 domain-containing protein n=1 Tax=Claviceps pusilla TaxID=123648 RepID=A0A9P7NC68_9HYPO|nr:hypothetical protein E4U43_007612 [Claviceps pusilla]